MNRRLWRTRRRTRAIENKSEQGANTETDGVRETETETETEKQIDRDR